MYIKYSGLILLYLPLSILNSGLHKLSKQTYKFTIKPSLDKFEFLAVYKRLPNLDLPKLPIIAA